MKLDVSCAFLHTECERRLYIELPSVNPDATTCDYLGRLRKALNGTRDAPQWWNQELRRALRTLGFESSRWRLSHCGEPVLVLLQHPFRFVREPRFPVLVRCCPANSPRSHSVQYCSLLTLRCSATPPFVSTTELPSCVVRCANRHQMLSVVFSDIQLRRHRRVHRSSRCSLRLVVGTPARHVACAVSIIQDVSDA